MMRAILRHLFNSMRCCSDRVSWVCNRQIQREANAFEVIPQILEVGVAVVEGPMGRELVLDQDLKARDSETMIWDDSVYRSRQNPWKWR